VRANSIATALPLALALLFQSGRSSAQEGTLIDSSGEFRAPVTPAHDTESAFATKHRVSSPTNSSSILRMAGSLVFVVALLVGFIYFIKRTSMPKARGPETDRLVVLARAPLGPRKEVVLLRAAGRHIVLAQTSSTVHALAQFPCAPGGTGDESGEPEDFAARLQDEFAPEEPPPPSRLVDIREKSA